MCLLILSMSLTILIPTLLPHLYLAYTCDVVFNVLVSCTTTIATFKIAHSLTTNLFGFVVGVNSCVASVLDLLISLIVVDQSVLGLGPTAQYWVYSAMGAASVVGYLVYRVYRVIHKLNNPVTSFTSFFNESVIIEEPQVDNVLINA